jgi:putative ABC transport system substrate-binding protein
MAIKFFKGILSALIAVISLNTLLNAQANTQPHVAITQITTHPSLDQIRQGIIDTLQQHNQEIKITFDNAQGSITNAANIAQKFAALRPDITIAITTPSAQTLAKSYQHQGLPLLFSASTDPIKAQLLKTVEAANGYITGVIDQPPIEASVKLMRRLQPTAKRIGVLYNAGEDNSHYQIKQLRHYASLYQFDLHEIAVTTLDNLQLAVLKLVSKLKVDALFLPNDNFVIAALDTILKGTQGTNIPVFACDPDSVRRGALAAMAIDQYTIGVETGKLALKILNGEPIAQVPPVILNTPQLYFNAKVAEKLGIDPTLFNQTK